MNEEERGLELVAEWKNLLDEFVRAGLVPGVEWGMNLVFYTQDALDRVSSRFNIKEEGVADDVE